MHPACLGSDGRLRSFGLVVIQAFLVPLLVVVVPPSVTYFFSKKGYGASKLCLIATAVSVATCFIGMYLGNWMIGNTKEAQPEMRFMISTLMIVPVNAVLALCLAKLPRKTQS